MTEPPESPYMTPKEYAAYVRADVRTIRRWRSKDIGPKPVLINGRPRYLRVAVEQWIARQNETQVPA